MKRILLITAIVLVLSMAFSAVSFAAPETLALDVAGNASGLLTVTNPANAVLSSYDKNHNISGYAADGANVSVYIASGGRYVIMKRNGVPVSCTVGASGMFVQPVYLNQGRSDLLVRAELNGQVQYAKRTVNVLSSNFLNLLKGFNLY